jgi:hypothetical protein
VRSNDEFLKFDKTPSIADLGRCDRSCNERGKAQKRSFSIFRHENGAIWPGNKKIERGGGSPGTGWFSKYIWVSTTMVLV